MLSVFPTFLSYGLVGITLLRVSVGLTFFILGYITITRERSNTLFQIRKVGFLPAVPTLILLAALEFVIGLSLLAGLYTQIGGLVGAGLSLLLLVLSFTPSSIRKSSKAFYTLLFVVSLSFLFIGPGMYAFDLPL